jgi:ectoine hydroxylase-related dioxygenase (phytanoyl-CoA dioxygenase family)
MLTPEQRQQFDRDGYIIVEDALAEIGLDRVRAAYERVQAETEAAWRQSVIDGTFKGGYGNGPDAHTMGNIHEYDDIFLDLAANPCITPILEEVVGPNFQVMEMVCHCHHAGTGAHTAWHRDWPPYRHPKYALKAKVFYFLDDQTEDMGCFSLVPGSHKIDDDPPREEYTGPTLEDMPGFKKIIGPAGSAIIWDVTCWHTGTANTGNQDRRIVIYGYQPFWVKKWGSSRPPQNIIDWANTPARRQMMGIHAVHGRASWDRQDVDYLPEHLEIVKGKKF